MIQLELDLLGRRHALPLGRPHGKFGKRAGMVSWMARRVCLYENFIRTNLAASGGTPTSAAGASGEPSSPTSAASRSEPMPWPSRRPEFRVVYLRDKTRMTSRVELIP
jgi:hypothetical protein